MKPACNKSLWALLACARHGCAAERAELTLRHDTIRRTILPNLTQRAAVARATKLLAKIEAALAAGAGR